MPPRALSIALVAVLLSACSTATRDTKDAEYLYVFAGDTAHGTGRADFMAVIDIDSASASYGKVVASVPLPEGGMMPHHVEMQMPAHGSLFANTYMNGRAHLFDFSDPLAPRVAGVADSVPGLHMPHSFSRLGDGSVLTTMQFGDGKSKGDAGGLALFSPEGRFLRKASSFDSTMRDSAIRTYSLDVAEQTDRVLTTSSPMGDERTADVVQLWRLSDLTLLHTLHVPVHSDTSSYYPFEVRFLADGRSAFMNTYYCGFYYLSALESNAPSIVRVPSPVYPRNKSCGVPQLIGHWWIMPVTAAHEFQVYDISDPMKPRLASTVATDPEFWPHWTSREPGTTRIVVSTDGPKSSVRMMHFDSTSGVLSWDQRFRETQEGGPGVSFNKPSWPHGAKGLFMPHGVVFSRKAAIAGLR